MSAGEGYNGWRNYETWVVKLWLDNDQGSYDEARRLVESAVLDAADDREDWWTEDMAHNREVSRIADFLSEWVGAMRPAGDASLYEDILTAGLERVDWREIALNYLSEVDA